LKNEPFIQFVITLGKVKAYFKVLESNIGDFRLREQGAMSVV